MKQARAFFLLLASTASQAATYYVDSATGDDAQAGTAPDAAWRTFTPVNRTTFSPGDEILLRAGQVWTAQALRPGGSGAPGAPIRIAGYGQGARPALRGEGLVPAVVELANQQYWEISGLEVSNLAPDGPQPLRGILLRAEDAGVLRHLKLHDLFIHDINAPHVYEDENLTAKSYGGIVTLITGQTVPTAWDGLLVDSCVIQDVSAIGMTMLSSWTKGHRANDPATWFPSRNVVIRGNVFERTARNGLVVRACAGAVVEHNLFRECAILGSGNASFAFHSDDTVFQFNEACYTKYNPGDHDAAGFDSDYNCRRSVFQFNYSHHNDYGFILLCNNGRNGFNEDTIVRYNISYNDGGNVIRLSGPVRGARIHNNTIIAGPGMSNPREGHPPRIIYHKSWHGWSDNTEFFNNIIVNLSDAAVYDAGQSTGNRYSHNLFFGRHPTGEPDDPHKLTVDPLFSAREPTGSDRDSVIVAFRLRPGSPAIGAGLDLPNRDQQDFAGQTIRPGPVDLGALVNGQSEGTP